MAKAAGKAKAKSDGNTVVSAGHKIGQVVGDWWELQVVRPMLAEVANELGLFLDNRVVSNEKVLWPDAEGNLVDYDFVLELRTEVGKRGVPVAFFESFWRRGARHSKDKARDDTNKLLPMRSTYPTARFLSIAASGEFTEPAREYVRSRLVELLFIPKPNIIAAFGKLGMQIDYPDNLPEEKKGAIGDALGVALEGKQKDVGDALRSIVGQGAFSSYKTRVLSALTATPQSIVIRALRLSEPMTFVTVEEATAFLEQPDPTFSFEDAEQEYTYEVTYSDGSDFSRQLGSMDEVKKLHTDLGMLVEHMRKVTAKRKAKAA